MLNFDELVEKKAREMLAKEIDVVEFALRKCDLLNKFSHSQRKIKFIITNAIAQLMQYAVPINEDYIQSERDILQYYKKQILDSLEDQLFAEKK